MINYVFLSPHFPSSFANIALRLKQTGQVNVLGIADTAWEELDHQLRQEGLTEYFRVDSMDDYSQVYRAVAYFIHKYGRVHYIESHNEHWLDLEARLRTDYNVTSGFKIDELMAKRKKSYMKEIFRSIGIMVANGFTFTNIDQARDILYHQKLLSFPVCVKPDTGVGARDTYKLRNDHDLVQFFERKHWNLGETYIMEEFINGKIITFDGIVDHEGRVIFSASLDSPMPVMDIVNNDVDMNYSIEITSDDDARDLGLKIVKAFDLRNRFFHIEFFRRDDGGLTAIEVNMRVPGYPTIDMWNHAYERDCFADYANMIIRSPHQINPEWPVTTAKKICCFSNRKYSRFHYIHSHEEIMRRYGHLMAADFDMPPVFRAVMGEHVYLHRSENKDQMWEIHNFITAKYL